MSNYNIPININDDDTNILYNGLDSILSFLNMSDYDFYIQNINIYEDVIISIPTYISDIFYEEEMLVMAQEESMEYYNTQEKKDNIYIDHSINKYIIDDDKYLTLKHDECAICRDKFELENDVTELDCGHTLHSNCISEWIKYKSNCPICRAEIKTTTT